MIGSFHERFDGIDLAALVRPVPDMTVLRARKLGYNNLPIDTSNPLFTEQLDEISKYGLAGRAYYSRPNETTGDPVPGVSPDLYLRHSLVEKLARINNSLSGPEIANFFGGEVELYVQDALRPIALQTELHDVRIPALIRQQQPDISDNDLAERVRAIIAMPSTDPLHPSPHTTGAAVDVILRFTQSTKNYVPNCDVPMGHTQADTTRQIEPDFFERHKPSTDAELLGQRNRRAFYAIMSGAAFGTVTNLVNNPTEWWHWSYGDQLAMQVSGKPAAFYSIARE